MTEQDKNQQNQQYQNDDIDLRKLFQAIGNLFANIWKGFILILVGTKRATISHILLFIILIIVGGAIGYFSGSITDPYYRTSMLLHSSVFKGQLIENSIEKLNTLCQQSDRTELAKILKLPIEIADSIKGFESIPFVSEEEIIQVEILREQLKNLNTDEYQINNVIERIQIENKSTYEIVALVYSTRIMSKLEEPLINYIRQNPYVSKRLESTQRNRTKKKDKILRESEKLDSLKNVIYRNLSILGDRSREGSNNVILAEDNMANPLNVVKEDMDLYDELLKIEELLVLEPEFEVVDGFTTFSRPEGPSRSKDISDSILIAIGLGYLFIILKGVNSYLTKVEKEQNEVSG